MSERLGQKPIKDRVDMEDAFEVMVKAVMKRAGLSEFDREYVEADVNVIITALEKNGFYLMRKRP